jgi:hypothetical protein
MQKTAVRGLCFLFAVISSMTGTAGAGMIDVYFIGGGPVTVTGAGVVGNSGDYWNGVTTQGTSGSNIVLSNTSNQSTGVSLSYSGAGGDGGPFFSPISSPNPNLTSTFADSYTGNTPNNVISLSLSGLSPLGTYNLYVYDVADYRVGTSRPGIVSIGATNGGASVSFDGNGNLSTWVSGSNYVLLSFTASASGALSFSISPSGGNHEVDLNGFQLISLSSVPEPSSVVLLGSGAIVLLGYVQVRRRRSQMTPA